jgi:hypothetical protein
MNSPQRAGWLTRLFVTLMTVALVIVGFFFFTIALAAGAVIAAVIGARLWWTLRKLKRAQASGGPADIPMGHDQRDAVEGEYQVVEREGTAVRLPPRP